METGSVYSLTGRELKVYRAIVELGMESDNKFYCYANNSTISEKAKIKCIRNLQQSLRSLIEKGFISRRFNGDIRILKTIN